MVIVFALLKHQYLSSSVPQSSVQLALSAVEAESYHRTYRKVGVIVLNELFEILTCQNNYFFNNMTHLKIFIQYD